MITGRRRTLRERLMMSVRVDTNTGCWNWLKHVNASGYGCTAAPGFDSTLAHRISYGEYVGAIGREMVVHHKCKNRICINPEHLGAMTHKEHGKLTRGPSPTHCPKGHVYDAENARVFEGTNHCKACQRIANKASKAKRRANGGKTLRKTIKERISAKVDICPETQCWIWNGCRLHPNGYGVINIAGKPTMPHIASYREHVGPIAPRMNIHHKCEVKLCCNPEHLEQLTRKEHAKITFGKKELSYL